MQTFHAGMLIMAIPALLIARRVILFFAMRGGCRADTAPRRPGPCHRSCRFLGADHRHDHPHSSRPSWPPSHCRTQHGGELRLHVAGAGISLGGLHCLADNPDLSEHLLCFLDSCLRPVPVAFPVNADPASTLNPPSARRPVSCPLPFAKAICQAGRARGLL